jgi:hypothetical protein
MFINQNELEYQVKYPLTRRNKREGVLNKHTMRDAIYALIERAMSLRLFLRKMNFSPTTRALQHARRTIACILSVVPLHVSPQYRYSIWGSFQDGSVI